MTREREAQKDGDPNVKRFNTTGICIPSKHYMVDISERLKEIRKMVDAGMYFCINRGRQYGKTTTLSALENALSEEYQVVSLDFQGIGTAGFATEESFVKAFSRAILKKKYTILLPGSVADELTEYIHRKDEKAALDELFITLSDWCASAEKPLVLFIDEVDSASSNEIFLDFLAQLRLQYLEHQKDSRNPAFHSVILAGVTDVKNLKRKLRPDEAHKENSPWNIASEFTVDMSLSEPGIRDMLEEYEGDHHTGMDTALMANRLRAYTSGYPYLVSRLCQLMDGAVSKAMGPSAAWTEEGLDEAIKIMLADGDDTLFGSLMSKLNSFPQLKTQLRGILMRGDVIPWQPYDPEQAQLRMYGFIKNEHNTVAIANRIFEMLLYHYFLGESGKNEAFRSDALVYRSIFISDDNSLNMPLILEHFVETHRRIHGDSDDRFLEEEGRERFLTYLAPIINGVGTYSIEEQTRDRLRMDVVIHYLGKRYVVELKIWRGPRYHENGEKQILEYLDYFGLTTGYMVSFNFNQNKEPGVRRVSIGDRVLFEATV